jgi:hypothetical protein
MPAVFDIRFIALTLALFAGAFFGVRWLAAGAPVPLPTVVPLQADARLPTFVEKSRQDIGEANERDWLASQTVQGDDDAERNKLRAAVIEAATAFTVSPCNDPLKQQYLAAAAAYARAFVTLGGCPNYPSCVPDHALMERANQIFRSPADARAKRAIDAVHKMGISIKDYPNKIGPAVSHLAGSGSAFPGDEPFSCSSAQARAAKPLDDSRAGTPAPGPVAQVQDRKEIDRYSRELYRNRTIEMLRRPGPAWCSEPGRRDFLGGLNQYYSVRYGALHTGVRSREEQLEIEKAWSTAVDKQIDTLVREFFVVGYFRRQDLRKSPLVDEVLAGAVSGAHACDSRT